MPRFSAAPWALHHSISILVQGADHQIICVVNSSNSSREDLANAHLIAAAPELYHACRRVLAELDEDDGISVGAQEDLEFALAKAEGGE